eukprot:6197340-Pleurochrysis_carterae.AAC.1
MDGVGSYEWVEKQVRYEGEFKSNKICGSGIYNWPDGNVYEGQVVDGLRHGHGSFVGKGGAPKVRARACARVR